MPGGRPVTIPSMTPPTLSRPLRASSISAIMRSAASKSAHLTGVRSEPFRELDAIFLLPLGGQEALAGPTAVELRLHRPRIDWCAGSEPLDRAANEGAMARPEDRRPVPRAEGVHPTTAWRAPSARMSSRNDGYETWKHHGSERSRGPLAVRPATAAAISIR